jgi:hypothetical protein
VRDALEPGLDPKVLHEYLRRARIIEVFVLRFDNPDRLNWDEILSVSELPRHFDVPCALLERGGLQEFRFAPVPTEFLNFMLEPYWFDITSAERKSGICLLTGKLVSLQLSIDGTQSLTSHLSRALANTFTLVVPVTGADAGGLALVSDCFTYKYVKLKSIYVDAWGYEDRGGERGEILRLSDANVAAAMEQLLSGEWVDLIQS